MRRVQLLHEGVMCWQWFEYLDPLRQRFDLAAQLRIAEVEVEYKIPQGVCIDISQFFFECIDVHRTKWKFIKSFRLVQIKSLAPERIESFPHQTRLSRFHNRQLISGCSATTW